MNKKFLILLIVIVSVITIGFGCTKQNTNNQINLPQTPTSTTITYYLLNNSTIKTDFCDGNNMDSVGFKSALIQKIITKVDGNLITEVKIKNTLSLAADAGSFNEVYTRTASTTFENGVVTMHSANGWAGSSIFYCAWKPFVEKNLEQFDEVKKIEWGVEEGVDTVQVLSLLEKNIGYLKNIYEKEGVNYLDIDYIQWLNSEECKLKNIDAPGGFCILNQNTEIRTFEVSKKVEILMQTFSHTTDGNYNWNEKISYEKFKNVFVYSQSQKSVPYNIEIENNIVVRIIEQYVP